MYIYIYIYIYISLYIYIYIYNIYVFTYKYIQVYIHMYMYIYIHIYSTLQHTATHCNTLQHTATHCNTLQHTTTHYKICCLHLYLKYRTFPGVAQPTAIFPVLPCFSLLSSSFVVLNDDLQVLAGTVCEHLVPLFFLLKFLLCFPFPSHHVLLLLF